MICPLKNWCGCSGPDIMLNCPTLIVPDQGCSWQRHMSSIELLSQTREVAIHECVTYQPRNQFTCLWVAQWYFEPKGYTRALYPREHCEMFQYSCFLEVLTLSNGTLMRRTGALEFLFTWTSLLVPVTSFCSKPHISTTLCSPAGSALNNFAQRTNWHVIVKILQRGTKKPMSTSLVGSVMFGCA